jgi:hypothetical protein
MVWFAWAELDCRHLCAQMQMTQQQTAMLQRRRPPPPPSACRYCGLACAKQHWKHHKASCKRAAAARETAAGEQGQQQAQGQA